MRHVRPFHITGSSTPRPPSRATLWCDGSSEDGFRDGIDLELSHWLPNRTPEEFRADTSTEICLNWAAAGAEGAYDLAVNNHLDCDGVLSVLVAVAPAYALEHRAVLVGAAEMGDFWAWADVPSQALYEGLAVLMRGAQGDDLQEVYGRCLDAVPRLLGAGAAERPAVAPGLAALARSVDAIESGRVRVERLTPSLVRFAYPREVVGEDVAAALRAPGFNAPLAESGPLHPHARNLAHREDVHLVSIEVPGGWSHELWYPGYAWADAVRVRRPPGLRMDDHFEFLVEFPALAEAVNALTGDERAPGRWTLARKVSAFAAVPGRDFPIVVSFLAPGGVPTGSALGPDEVGRRFAEAFGDV